MRYGLRQLRKSPGFTAVAVVSLALGIGANTAIFSVLNAVLLRALPVREPHELRVLTWAGNNIKTSYYSGGGSGHTAAGKEVLDSFPYPAYTAFRNEGTGFSEVFAFCRLYDLTAITRAGATTSDSMLVSGNFFSGYGASTLIGRPIMPADDQPDAEPVTVITYRAWERWYGLDPNVLGQTVALNKTTFTIIGVLPRSYIGPVFGGPVHFYVPMAAQPHLRPGYPLTSDIHWWVQIMARRAPEVPEAQARASLGVLFDRFLRSSSDGMDQPEILLADGSRGLLAERYSMARPLWVLQGVVSLVLLIACANIASLLLARGAARRHEMAVRAVMGAGRWRLMRQSLTESLVLSLAGAGLGLVFAGWIKMAVNRLFAGLEGDINVDIRTDGHVLAFTLAAAILTTFLFGLFPAWRAGRADPSAGLKDSAVRMAPRLRLGKVLVAAQVSLSVLLVMGAGLLLRTLVNLYKVNTGFDMENLLVFRLNPAQAGYKGQELVGYYDRVREVIRGLPSVRSVALSSITLLSGSSDSYGINIPGRATDEHLQSNQMIISDGFFFTLGIGLLSGRDFSPADNQASARVAIVNETFCKSLFPNENCLGKTFKVGNTEYQIVGLCCDARYDNLRVEVPPIMYFTYRQSPKDRMTFEIRGVLPAVSLVPAVSRLVAGIDRNIPLEEITTQMQVVRNTIVPERLFTGLCSALALLALLLSCIGLHGLMAYNVTRRTPEIGIRLALGARPRDVASPILREALILAGMGTVIGMPVALVLTRLIRSTFFGVEPHDPSTVAGSIILLLSVAVLAAWVPARRAARIDPMEALRYE